MRSETERGASNEERAPTDSFVAVATGQDIMKLNDKRTHKKRKSYCDIRIGHDDFRLVRSPKELRNPILRVPCDPNSPLVHPFN